MTRAKGETKTYDSGARYRAAWGKSAFDALDKVTEEERMERNKNAAEINEAYYDIITDHYQGGWGNKFHFCGYQPEESWEAAQARHEHHLAMVTDIKPGMKVLDVGCGVGGPAREIAIFTGANITGITISELQVERSNAYNTEANLSDQVNMIHGNMIDLPFPDASFDRVYSTEALCCAPDVHKAYSEIYRVLKPGGKLGFLDWVITDKYDDSNARHRKIRSEIELGSAVPHLTTVDFHNEALKKAGFALLLHEDRAIAKANPIPWWWSLDGKHATTLYDKYKSWALGERPFRFVYFIYSILHKLNLLHPSRMMALDTVSMCVYSCRDGGREGLFSPMHLFVCEKPEQEKE
ncbi:S-adenosyl-L-methionine-dependent methyltransferase [Pleomassaria siparia CBS 279.74]|uniref:Sterol 24-C-methyltransferase n=1 Tax=Pleomassaria siparia CBS 279.74 TaxID=1314801 RepID=A0A6G1JQ76_9PLEO|nr:S-adenosyl-L-methionine-dependent methyltransferase [Pleomassaria siparia CBS 279.74]